MLNTVNWSLGSISGTVTYDEGKPVSNEDIAVKEMQNQNGTVVLAKATTRSVYTGPDLEPGDYVLVEKNPLGYLDNIRDYDTAHPVL
jgi:hypothetical protein